MRLSGNAGTGNKILKNWAEFSYTITSDTVEKENAKGERYIDKDTLLTSKNSNNTRCI